MRYLSVCSGIEAASVAWRPLGWNAVAFAEIEPFPCAVLAYHYPDVDNLGDIENFRSWPDAEVDVLVGGTPCQSFSVAGLRAGLDDPRGNLALVYLAVAERYRPKWVVWENVPGVLSSDGGRAMGSFLGGLAKIGYGFAYRVLDAQYVRVDGHPRAVPQRRRRVFVVGYLGDWRPAAAVLFEPESLSGNPAPRRETGERTAPTLDGRAGRSGENSVATSGRLVPETCSAIKARDHKGPSSDGDGAAILPVAHSLKAEGFDASEDGTGRGTPLVAAPLSAGSGQASQAGRRREDDSNLVAFAQNQRDEVRTMDVAGALAAAPCAKQQTYVMMERGRDGQQSLEYRAKGMAVRRLTPRECERLQGFPDDYTLIPYSNVRRSKLDGDFVKYLLRGNPKGHTREDVARLAADGPRYKALGNSMAVNVMRWIGQRIQAVSDLMQEAA